MKHLVIDARLYGPKHTGIGRYTKNLLLALNKEKVYEHYKVFLIVYSELHQEIANDLGNNYHYIVTDLKHYSIAEQIFLPFLLYKLKPDLVHFTHLDKPLLYLGNSVVTVHDLIRHFSKGTDTSTHSPFFYWIKYIGYLFMTRVVFLNSHIIVPSNYWKKYIIANFSVNKSLIDTTYEAVDPKFLPSDSKFVKIPKPYLLYTGNLYPHKNIGVLIEAMSHFPNLRLKIICARSVFSQRIKKILSSKYLRKQVEFMGYVDDKNFKKIYRHATALVHPALIEGFSLTGLEAMALNCPVIASNATCLPEIYEQSVLYFDPHNVEALVSNIRRLANSPSLRAKLIKTGQKQVTKFSWKKTALATLKVYKKTL